LPAGEVLSQEEIRGRQSATEIFMGEKEEVQGRFGGKKKGWYRKPRLVASSVGTEMGRKVVLW